MNARPDIPADTDLAEALLPVAISAGAAILAVRRAGAHVEWKADSSPVTEADRAAEAVISAALAEIAPGVPVIAEEAAYEGRVPETGAAFFLVDPLDGTKEFVKGGNDFTVNIGLIRNGAPALGVILLPETGKLFWGVVGAGAWRGLVVDGTVTERRPIRVRAAPDGPIAVVASRSHRSPETDAYIRRYEVEKLVSAGSSMKFCVLAAGKADLYPRMGTTMQWDTAAGDAILRAAGGMVVTLDGKPFTYGPKDGAGAEAYRNPWFIAAGSITPLTEFRPEPPRAPNPLPLRERVVREAHRVRGDWVQSECRALQSLPGTGRGDHASRRRSMVGGEQPDASVRSFRSECGRAVWQGALPSPLAGEGGARSAPGEGSGHGPAITPHPVPLPQTRACPVWHQEWPKSETSDFGVGEGTNTAGAAEARSLCFVGEGTRRPNPSRKPVPPIAGFARNPPALALIKGCFMLGGGQACG